MNTKSKVNINLRNIASKTVAKWWVSTKQMRIKNVINTISLIQMEKLSTLFFFKAYQAIQAPMANVSILQSVFSLR
jgi:hypothetical protein